MLPWSSTWYGQSQKESLGYTDECGDQKDIFNAFKTTTLWRETDDFEEQIIK